MLFPFYAGLEFQEQGLNPLLRYDMGLPISDDWLAIKAIPIPAALIIKIIGTISHRTLTSWDTSPMPRDSFFPFRCDYPTEDFSTAIRSLQTVGSTRSIPKTSRWGR